jgi:DNA primase
MKIPTREAVRWIKLQYNLDPEQKTITSARPAKSLHRGNGKIYKAIKQSSKNDGREFSYIYQDLLYMLDPEGAAIYLECRGIRRNITRRAGIKVIPKDMKAIKKALNDKYGIERLQDAGFVAASSSGRPFFVFIHHRFIIPYYDIEGNIINLQGRDIDSGSGAKYRFLSGIAVPMYNRQALKDLAPGATIYLCEGAIDVLSALQLGLDTPIGIAGVNNFKPEYFDVLAPYRLVIASDQDAAGRAFYLRVKKEFLKRGKEVYAIDFNRLKTEYNISGAVKDLNDIARQADYGHHDNIRKQQIPFNDGVKYTAHELERLVDITQAERQGIYKIKKTFQGVIL